MSNWFEKYFDYDSWHWQDAEYWEEQEDPCPVLRRFQDVIETGIAHIHQFERDWVETVHRNRRHYRARVR